MRPQDTLAPEADLLGDSLGGRILDVGRELERVAAQPPEGTSRNPATAGLTGTPAADRAALPLAEPQPDRSNEPSVLCNRELVWPEPKRVGDEGASVVVGVGPRQPRQPALQLAIPARGIDPASVVLPPGAQHDPSARSSIT